MQDKEDGEECEMNNKEEKEEGGGERERGFVWFLCMQGLEGP